MKRACGGLRLFRPVMSKVLNEFRNQTFDAKHGHTGYEQLKPRRHLHGVACEVDSRLGSDGRRHREDDKKHPKD